MKSTFNGKEYWGHPKFYEFLEKMAEVHSRKNHDYSGDGDPLKNLRAPTRLGITPFIGVMVRLQDKASRLEQFVNSGELMVKDESVLDTLIDQANYSILAAILYQEELDNLTATEPAAPAKVQGLCKDCAKHETHGGTCGARDITDPRCFREVK